MKQLISHSLTAAPFPKINLNIHPHPKSLNNKYTKMPQVLEFHSTKLSRKIRNQTKVGVRNYSIIARIHGNSFSSEVERARRTLICLINSSEVTHDLNEVFFVSNRHNRIRTIVLRQRSYVRPLRSLAKWETVVGIHLSCSLNTQSKRKK